VDCIHPKKNTVYADGRPGFDQVDKLYIDPGECMDCGACVPVCPVSAIFSMDDLPEKWRHYAEIDASYVVDGQFQAEKFQLNREAPG
jgi:NAD-dependent dihydropyrimidine dehydrogenase PreA subunit